MQEHVQQYGPNCLSCHDGAGNMQNFDHSRVFALDGAHASLECAACHADHKFQGTPSTCAACHQEPKIHAGLFGTECQNCHTTSAWAPAQLTRHTFPIDHGEQGEQSCATCHTQTYTAYTCYGCHEHNPRETQAQHAEKGITGEALLKCADCHAAGKVEGDN
ncbi:MAG: cytochrome c3 family protein [Anaerolineales bacterium]